MSIFRVILIFYAIFTYKFEKVSAHTIQQSDLQQNVHRLQNRSSLQNETQFENQETFRLAENIEPEKQVSNRSMNFTAEVRKSTQYDGTHESTFNPEDNVNDSENIRHANALPLDTVSEETTEKMKTFRNKLFTHLDSPPESRYIQNKMNTSEEKLKDVDEVINGSGKYFQEILEEQDFVNKKEETIYPDVTQDGEKYFTINDLADNSNDKKLPNVQNHVSEKIQNTVADTNDFIRESNTTEAKLTKIKNYLKQDSKNIFKIHAENTKTAQTQTIDKNLLNINNIHKTTQAVNMKAFETNKSQILGNEKDSFIYSTTEMMDSIIFGKNSEASVKKINGINTAIRSKEDAENEEKRDRGNFSNFKFVFTEKNATVLSNLSDILFKIRIEFPFTNGSSENATEFQHWELNIQNSSLFELMNGTNFLNHANVSVDEEDANDAMPMKVEIFAKQYPSKDDSSENESNWHELWTASPDEDQNLNRSESYLKIKELLQIMRKILLFDTNNSSFSKGSTGNKTEEVKLNTEEEINTGNIQDFEKHKDHIETTEIDTLETHNLIKNKSVNNASEISTTYSNISLEHTAAHRKFENDQLSVTETIRKKEEEKEHIALENFKISERDKTVNEEYNFEPNNKKTGKNEMEHEKGKKENHYLNENFENIILRNLIVKSQIRLLEHNDTWTNMKEIQKNFKDNKSRSKKGIKELDFETISESISRRGKREKRNTRSKKEAHEHKQTYEDQQDMLPIPKQTSSSGNQRNIDFGDQKYTNSKPRWNSTMPKSEHNLKQDHELTSNRQYETSLLGQMRSPYWLWNTKVKYDTDIADEGSIEYDEHFYDDDKSFTLQVFYFPKPNSEPGVEEVLTGMHIEHERVDDMSIPDHKLLQEPEIMLPLGWQNSDHSNEYIINRQQSMFRDSSAKINQKVTEVPNSDLERKPLYNQNQSMEIPEQKPIGHDISLQKETQLDIKSYETMEIPEKKPIGHDIALQKEAQLDIKSYETTNTNKRGKNQFSPRKANAMTDVEEFDFSKHSRNDSHLGWTNEPGKLMKITENGRKNVEKVNHFRETPDTTMPFRRQPDNDASEEKLRTFDNERKQMGNAKLTHVSNFKKNDDADVYPKSDISLSKESVRTKPEEFMTDKLKAETSELQVSSIEKIPENIKDTSLNKQYGSDNKNAKEEIIQTDEMSIQAKELNEKDKNSGLILVQTFPSFVNNMVTDSTILKVDQNFNQMQTAGTLLPRNRKEFFSAVTQAEMFDKISKISEKQTDNRPHTAHHKLRTGRPKYRINNPQRLQMSNLTTSERRGFLTEQELSLGITTTKVLPEKSIFSEDQVSHEDSILYSTGNKDTQTLKNNREFSNRNALSNISGYHLESYTEEKRNISVPIHNTYLDENSSIATKKLKEMDLKMLQESAVTKSSENFEVIDKIPVPYTKIPNTKFNTELEKDAQIEINKKHSIGKNSNESNSSRGTVIKNNYSLNESNRDLEYGESNFETSTTKEHYSKERNNMFLNSRTPFEAENENSRKINANLEGVKKQENRKQMQNKSRINPMARTREHVNMNANQTKHKEILIQKPSTNPRNRLREDSVIEENSKESGTVFFNENPNVEKQEVIVTEMYPVSPKIIIKNDSKMENETHHVNKKLNNLQRTKNNFKHFSNSSFGNKRNNVSSDVQTAVQKKEEKEILIQDKMSSHVNARKNHSIDTFGEERLLSSEFTEPRLQYPKRQESNAKDKQELQHSSSVNQHKAKTGHFSRGSIVAQNASRFSTNTYEEDEVQNMPIGKENFTLKDEFHKESLDTSTKEKVPLFGKELQVQQPNSQNQNISDKHDILLKHIASGQMLQNPRNSSRQNGQSDRGLTVDEKATDELEVTVPLGKLQINTGIPLTTPSSIQSAQESVSVSGQQYEQRFRNTEVYNTTENYLATTNFKPNIEQANINKTTSVAEAIMRQIVFANFSTNVYQPLETSHQSEKASTEINMKVETLEEEKKESSQGFETTSAEDSTTYHWKENSTYDKELFSTSEENVGISSEIEESSPGTRTVKDKQESTTKVTNFQSSDDQERENLSTQGLTMTGEKSEEENADVFHSSLMPNFSASEITFESVSTI